jgi:hypothetical protein
MFEEIRKPKILKNVPSMFIRVLPPIYYYLKYLNPHSPKTAYPLYNSSLIYLKKSLLEIGENAPLPDLIELGNQADMFFEQNHKNLAPCFNEFVERLSLQCGKNLKLIRSYLKENRSRLLDSYKSSVKKLNVLVLNNNPDSELRSQLAKKLENFCHYNVQLGTSGSLSFSTQVLSCDFGIFTSTSSSRIHEEVKTLTSFQRPGLAIVSVGDTKADAQAIRHGAQLQRSGYAVIFKVFTPIRLYTSIDKEYMRFHLN